MKTITLIFTLVATSLWAQNNVTRAEYFFDSDPGFHQGTSVAVASPSQDVTLSFNADLSSLTPGFHILYVRAKSDSGWSLCYTKPFLKENAAYLDGLPDLSAAEYFFDTDPGYGSGFSIASIPSDSDITKSFVADLSSVSPGFHIMYVRAKDATGTWSLTYSKPFLKESASFADTPPNITGAEYYIDTDPGFGSGTSVSLSAGQNVTQSFVADLSLVAPGFHILYVRAKDANGMWSIVYSKPFLKENASLQDENPSIVGAEYFFDTDPGLGLGTEVPNWSSGPDVSFPFVADLSGLTSGFHILYVRTKDVNGTWSLAYARPFLKENDASSSIAALQYYYTKHGVSTASNTYALTPTNDATVNFLANTSGLIVDSTYEIHMSGVDQNGLIGSETVRSFVLRSGGLPNKAPFLSAPLSDRVVTEDLDSLTVALLDSVFSDSMLIFGIDSLRYSVSVSNAKLTAGITNDVLKLYGKPDSNGTIQVYLTATDDSNAVARDTVSVTINAVNDKPVAILDTAYAIGGVSRTIAVLTNDFDVEGNTLSLAAISAVPLHGTAGLSGNLVQYTGTATYTGLDSLRYRVGDGQGGFDSAWVRIQVTAGVILTMNVSTSILQNPALSKYADVIVTLDTTLGGGLSVKSLFGSDSTTIGVALLTGTTRTYMGAIEFEQTGTYQIRVQATGVNGAVANSVKPFTVSLAKPNASVMAKSVDGKVSVAIAAKTFRDETYIVGWEKSESGETSYEFSPRTRGEKSMTISIAYDPMQFTDPSKLFICQKVNGVWEPLRTQVFTETNTLRSQTVLLGEFKVMWDAGFAGSNLVPLAFELKQNYPNPFNPSTVIAYDLPKNSRVSVVIYNLLGQKVKTLVREEQLAGSYRIAWNGTNETGHAVTSGVYLYRIETGSDVRTKKMMLIK